MSNEKIKTVAEDMDQRRVFSTAADALAYLGQMQETLSDFHDVPSKFVGLVADDDGNPSFDPEIYTDSTRIMVAVLKAREEGSDGKKSNQVKALVVTPVPTLDAILADDAAREWLVSKVLDKELNHIAVRNLRDADDIESVDNMPVVLGDFISSARAAGGQFEVFNAVYRTIGTVLAKKFKIWGKYAPKKADLRNAMASRAFANEWFAPLEDREKGSLFVLACQLGQQLAKAEGLDPAIFDKWLAERDNAELKAGDDDEDVTLDDLTAGLFAEDAAE